MKIDFTNVAVAFIAGALAAVGTVATGAFGYWNKNRELDIRMVDVALTILSAKDEATNSRYAKKYALDLLEHYGGQEIGDKSAWASESKSLPVGQWPSATLPQKKDMMFNGVDLLKSPDVLTLSDLLNSTAPKPGTFYDWEKFKKDYGIKAYPQPQGDGSRQQP